MGRNRLSSHERQGLIVLLAALTAVGGLLGILYLAAPVPRSVPSVPVPDTVVVVQADSTACGAGSRRRRGSNADKDTAAKGKACRSRVQGKPRSRKMASPVPARPLSRPRDLLSDTISR